jgi:hypothetical protein
LFDESELKQLLARQNISRKTKILAVLSIDEKSCKTVSEIKAVAEAHGLREVRKWNISQILNVASDMVVRLPKGWEITEIGAYFLLEQGLTSVSPARQYQNDLRKIAAVVTSDNTKAFLEECIIALETGLLRSATILSWVGAISILYDEVLLNHLSNFNAELKKRYPKKKQIKSTDDLATLKEHEFLQIIHAVSIIGKNVKQELEQCLQLRNACAHPNSLNVGERRIASHLEILILNVYRKFVL